MRLHYNGHVTVSQRFENEHIDNPYGNMGICHGSVDPENFLCCFKDLFQSVKLSKRLICLSMIWLILFQIFYIL